APGLEEPPGRLLRVELFRRLPGHPHELPTPTPRRTRGDGGRGPGGIASLLEVWPPLALVVGQRVDDEPVVIEAEVVLLNAHVVADEAVCTVGADDPIRRDLHVLIVIAVAAESDVHRLLVASQCNGLSATEQVDAVERSQPSLERVLEVRLVEGRQLRPTGVA